MKTRAASNITLKLNTELLRQVRILAAEEATSVSAFLAQRLEAMVRERRGFTIARRRALLRLRQGMDLGFTPPALWAELYER